MATITYRKLDLNGDPLWGGGQTNFMSDLEAIAQAIGTRLKLLQGEWWENLNLGTPIFQSMLGVPGSGKRPRPVSLLLVQRILSTPFVTGVSNVTTSYDPNARAFQFSCQVQTRFGTITVATQPPGASATLQAAAFTASTQTPSAAAQPTWDSGIIWGPTANPVTWG
jgi:hypothetical protein